MPSPLCSYAQISVNGEPWGLYLAVEGVEDAFMDRNGMTKGELYKPDSVDFAAPQQNRTEQLIWLGGCAALLLAAILIIRRAGSHNS